MINFYARTLKKSLSSEPAKRALRLAKEKKLLPGLDQPEILTQPSFVELEKFGSGKIRTSKNTGIVPPGVKSVEADFIVSPDDFTEKQKGEIIQAEKFLESGGVRGDGQEKEVAKIFLALGVFGLVVALLKRRK